MGRILRYVTFIYRRKYGYKIYQQRKMQIYAKRNKVEFFKYDLIPYETLVEYKNGTLCYNRISTEECGVNEVKFYLEDDYGQKSKEISIIIEIKL